MWTCGRMTRNRTTAEEFGIPDTDTAEEMMDAVESLSVEEIADKLAELGYAPDEE